MLTLKSLFQKYKDVIPYAIFGVFTTLVNIASYWLCAHALGMPVMASTIIAWILAVLFAYITNRKWVFLSQVKGRMALMKEMLSFFACRIATGLVDWVCMLVFVDFLHWNDVLIKTGANILVIILNYLASKLIIFKKQSRQTE